MKNYDANKSKESALETNGDIFNLIKIYITEDFELNITISLFLLSLLSILIIIIWELSRRFFNKKFNVVELNIKLGNIGSAKFTPNSVDVQIAHNIWTELKTRKAAVEIDLENDVIDEIYDSWYILFQKVREHIGNIPANEIKKSESTRKLINIAVDTLNEGLRPHLTQWNARYRNWLEHQKNELKNMPPQTLQKSFPEYEELSRDLLEVNKKLIQYAHELEKITIE